LFSDATNKTHKKSQVITKRVPYRALEWSDLEIAAVVENNSTRYWAQPGRAGAKHQFSKGCAVCTAKWPEESSCGSNGKLREAVPELLAVAWKLATAAVPLVTVGAAVMGGATMWVTFTRYVGAFRFVCCTHWTSALAL